MNLLSTTGPAHVRTKAVPVSHHLETACAYSVDDLAALLRISNFEFLLQKNGRLLVRSLDDSRHEQVVRRS